MTSATLSAVALGLASVLVAASAAAQSDPFAPVVTEHRIQVQGGTLAYTAEIGRIAIVDAETSEPHGYMGYIAYRARSKGALRPLTFVWNGGPGSDSSTLHFQMVGPKRGEGDRLVDNAETWLTDTDLVFVDPIGTGFSRPAKAEYAEEFYGTIGDVASVTEFVRAWRLEHGAEATPFFLAGESWGAGRAANAGYALLKQGAPLKGLVLISGGAGLDRPPQPPQLAAALRMADLAPVALYHGRLPGAAGQTPQEARRAAELWARETYAPALSRIDALTPDERDQIADGLYRHTGMPVDRIDRNTLTFSPRQYRVELLKDQKKILNIFDMRVFAEPAKLFEAAIPAYLRHELGYRTSLPYVGPEDWEQAYRPAGKPFQGPGPRWDYATAPVTPEARAAAMEAAMRTAAGPPRLGPPLPGTAEAVALSPNLKVMVVAGSMDSLNSCTANEEMQRQLPAELKVAMSFKCYGGGHMFYREQAVRQVFSQDFRAMIHAAP